MDDSFLVSIQFRYDSNEDELPLPVADRAIPLHPIFGDNLGAKSVKEGHASIYFSSGTNVECEGVFDVLRYLAIKIFQVSDRRAQFLAALRVLLRNSFDHLVQFAIATTLKKVLTAQRTSYLCQITEGKLVDVNLHI